MRVDGGFPALCSASVLAALATASSAAASPPPSTLRATVVASESRPAALPPRSQIEVLWGGEPVDLEAVRRISAADSPWTLAIYVDAPTTRPEALALAASRLAGEAELLVALGEVRLVLADPEPRTLLDGSRDAAEVEEALLRLERESLATGELTWLRQRYESLGGDVDALRAAEALKGEEELLEAQQRRWLAWVETTPARTARAVLLVSDGFDLEPEQFYSRGLAEELRTGSRLRRTFEETTRRTGGSGWRVLALSLGDRSASLLQPQEPLSELARATGGQVIAAPKALPNALASLSRRLELDLRLPVGAEQNDPLPLAIRWPRGSEVTTPRWLASGSTPPSASARVAESQVPETGPRRRGKVIRLVPPLAVEGAEAQVAVLSTRRDIARVEFVLDGRPLVTSGPPPLEVRVGLDPAKGPVRLEARALSRRGEVLGTDSLLLATRQESAQLEIASLVEGPEPGRIDLSATVRLPAGRRVERMEFLWNEQLIEVRDGPPYEVRIDGGEPSPGDFARVVAQLDDGSRLEAARFAHEGGLASSVDVNLIEVYALVRARHETPAGLGRADFALFQGDEPRVIEGFAQASDLPIELGLAIDTSVSMEPWMDIVRTAATSFLESVLGPEDEGFLVDFERRPRLAHAPTRDRESLIRRLGALRAAGHTSLYDSILYSLLQFDARRSRRALVVLSDGEDSDSHFGPKECIQQAQSAGVPVYLISLGDPPDLQRSPMRLINSRLAQETGGTVYYLSDPSRLEEIYQRIAEDLRSHYLLTFSTDHSLSEREMREIRVQMRDPKLTVRTLVSEG